MSRHATVAWLKRKVFRRSGTQEIYGLHKELAIAEMRTTRHARVAWGKENFVRQDWARNQGEQEIKKRRHETFRVQQGPKGRRPKTAAAMLEANRRPRCQTATMSEEEENNERIRRMERRRAITSGKQRNAQQKRI
jgi:hypothetical protein